MDLSDADVARQELTVNPSPSGWELELRYLLEGDRDFAVVQLGSPQEYVEVILEESDDPSLAQTCFHEALRNIVHSWHPSRPESETHIATMLALIAAFTPPEGFTKILGFIQGGLHFGQNTKTKLSHDKIRVLHRRALTGLSYYYPVAPPSLAQQDLGFVAYIDMLRGHLKLDDYCDYALLRLYDLQVIDLGADEVLASIQRTLRVVEELVTSVLEKESGSQLAASLSKVYSHCLVTPGATDAFESALALCGATLEHDEDGPLVRNPTELLEIDVPNALMVSYLNIRWTKAPRRAFSKLATMDAVGSELSN